MLLNKSNKKDLNEFKVLIHSNYDTLYRLGDINF